MKVACYCSGHEVIAKGTLFTFERDGNARLELNHDDFSISVEFRFESTPDGVPACNSEDDGKSFTFICRNFNYSAGSGTTSPIPLARYEGRLVYLVFWISYTGANSPRKIEYNFYLE